MGRETAALKRAGALPALARREPRGNVVWTPAHEACLGTVSDRALAGSWGVDESCVYWRRRVLRIAAFGGQGRPRRWTAPMIAALRTHLDRHLADRFGITVSSVAIKRRELGIATTARRHNAIT